MSQAMTDERAEDLEFLVRRSDIGTQTPGHLGADKAEDQNPDLQDPDRLPRIEVGLLAHGRQSLPEGLHRPPAAEDKDGHVQ